MNHPQIGKDYSLTGAGYMGEKAMLNRIVF
jgi:hypothetical protein